MSKAQQSQGKRSVYRYNGILDDHVISEKGIFKEVLYLCNQINTHKTKSKSLSYRS